MRHPAMQVLHVGLIHLPWPAGSEWIARKEDPIFSHKLKIYIGYWRGQNGG